MSKQSNPARDGIRKNMLNTIWKSRISYFMLAPFAILFGIFIVLPVVISMGLSFTSYNILEAPKWVWMKNYTRLFLADDIFLVSVKNTFLLAAITGPVSYIMSLLFAWFINELPKRVRSVMVLIFYAPSISGNVFLIWQIMFSGDSYGYANGILMKLGIIREPIQWLSDTKYMMAVIIIVVLWMSLGTGFLSFVAGLQTIDGTLYEAGLIDGISSRWQELWFITLPAMKPMLMFGAVMSITASFTVGDITQALAGMPSTDYAAHTVINHLVDYGSIRYEMGYASAIATVLFVAMLTTNKLVQKLLSNLGK